VELWDHWDNTDPVVQKVEASFVIPWCGLDQCLAQRGVSIGVGTQNVSWVME
jgi:hypothetical protein